MTTIVAPEKIMAIVFTWPDHAVTWEAAAWLYNLLPPGNIFSIRGKDHQTIRNEAVVRMVLTAPPEIEQVVLMDRDMRPDGASVPVLQVPGDVAGCLYPIPDMRGWAQPDAIHLGLVRVARKVFEALDPPWFMRTYSKDATAWAQCECGSFAAKAREAGFSVARAGWCDHDVSNDWHNGR